MQIMSSENGVYSERMYYKTTFKNMNNEKGAYISNDDDDDDDYQKGAA
jgi:hypothetical protein